MEKKTPSPFKSWLLIGLVGVTFLMLFRMDRNPVSSTEELTLLDFHRALDEDALVGELTRVIDREDGGTYLSGKVRRARADKDGKTIKIKNVNEPDMVVRVMIIADKDHLGDITLGKDWSGPDDDGWYYYGKMLKGSTDRDGDETSELRAEVNVSGNEDINDFDVVVVQEAERVVYDQDSEGNNIVSVPEGWNIDSISAE